MTAACLCEPGVDEGNPIWDALVAERYKTTETNVEDVFELIKDHTIGSVTLDLPPGSVYAGATDQPSDYDSAHDHGPAGSPDDSSTP